MGEPITRDEVKRAAEEARALAMPTSHARRPYDDKHGHSYMESDRDYTENNADAAVWALENAERIRAVPNLADHTLALLDALEAAEAEVARVRSVVEAAQRVVDAADACDREAERNHPSSRSSAPVVRAINAMKKLRAALLAAREATP